MDGAVATMFAGDAERGWRRWVLIALALGGVLAVVYPGPMFRGEVFSSADAQNYDAFKVVGDAARAAGNYPEWNPYVFAGMPTFGSASYLHYVYPPALIIGFLQGSLHFPPATWMLIHLLGGGLGVAFLLGCWRVPVTGQILGAAVWILLPKVVAWGVHGHGTKLMAAMYLPWIVAWTWRILGGRGWIAVGWLGLLLGLQFLRGHVQISYYTLLTVGWLALCHLIWPFGGERAVASLRTRWLRMGQLATGLVLGFCIGAVLLLPVREYARISIRGEAAGAGGGAPYSFAAGWSLAPAELPTFVLPSAAGFGKATYLGPMPFTDYPNYFGFLLLGLAALGVATGQRRLAIALGVLIFGTLLVAFGRHFPLHRWLYDWLPYFNKFRVPSMILILTGFAVALLAGLAIGRLGSRSGEPPPRWLGRCALALGILGGILLLSGLTGIAAGPYRSGLESLARSSRVSAEPPLLDEAWFWHRRDLIRIGLLLATAGAAVVLAVRRPRFRRYGLAWVLLVLVVWDLNAVDQRIVAPEKSLVQVATDAGGRSRLVAAPRLARPFRPTRLAGLADSEVARLAEVVGHDRIWPLGRAGVGSRFMAAGLRSLGGYHPAKLASYETIRSYLAAPEQPAGRVANWLAGRVLIVDRELPEAAFSFLASLGVDLERDPLVAGEFFAYRNRAALSRARLVTRWQRRADVPYAADLNAFLQAIQTGRHDYRDTVLLEETPDPLPRGDAPTGPAPVFLVDGLDEIVLQATTPEPALLVLADMDAPGWEVRVDGEPRPLLRADLALRAVALPAGQHEVRFTYHDPALRAGFSLSLVGVAGVALAFGAGWWARRRRESGSAPQSPIAPAPSGANGRERERG